MYEFWKERMLDSPETKTNFLLIVSNTRKTLPAFKLKLDELESKINLDQ